MKKAITLLVALMLSLGTAVALAGPGHAPPALKRKFMKKLGLDTKQIKKIEDLTYRADREKLDIRHEIQKNHLDLEQLMSAEKPNEAAIFSKLEKISALELKLKKNRISPMRFFFSLSSALELKLKKNRIGLMLKVKTILTPQQWEKLQEFQAARQAKRREKRMRRRMRRGMHDAPPGPPDAPEPPPAP
jgi:Spy/CpxP family protein refolding chaperone